MTLSPIAKRRIANFKNNRRGFISFVVIVALCIVSLFAEFIANDKPILMRFNDTFYMPIFSSYDEKTFGGDFDTEPDFRDPYVMELITGKDRGWMIWPPIKYSYKTINYNLPTPAPSSPTAENFLGTDDQGRDVFARVIYGFRLTMIFAIVLTFFSGIVGVIAGALQGYLGGIVDLLFQRIIEIWSGMPALFVFIILASMVTPNFGWLLLVMLLFTWTSLVGVVRAEFLKARNLEYVKAAKALGVPEPIIIFRHVLPNAMVATITYVPFILTGAITALTSLDFMGFGLPVGSPSLGELLAQGKTNLQAPWLGMTAFFAIALMLSLLIFIGEAVRDAFDPQKVWH
jgi:microcin C transport system permease protein